MSDTAAPERLCALHPDHFMPCSKCAGADCCPDTEKPITDWLWCEWPQPHPPHLWAERDPDEGTAVFACSGEGDE